MVSPTGGMTNVKELFKVSLTLVNITQKSCWLPINVRKYMCFILLNTLHGPVEKALIFILAITKIPVR